MNLLYKNILAFTFLLILSACGGGNSSNNSTNNIEMNQTQSEPFELADTVAINEKQYFRVISPTSCEQEHKNRFIYQVMHDSYLWVNDVPELDYTDSQYDSSEKILTALKNENDKFSFIIDAQTAQSFFEEGKNNNFGMGLALQAFDSTSYVLVIRYVYPNSPANKAGLGRGNIIQLVDDKNITEDSLDEIINILDSNSSVKFTFLNSDNSTVSKNLTKESYSIETVLYHNVFVNSDNSKRVGYLVFQDFIENALVELDTVFKRFKEANSNELILDLRYNGGGAVNVANHLASLIGGSHVTGNIFNHTLFNETYAKFNQTTYFEETPENALNLNRVFVITTGSTCSSSELVINALSASANNVEVIQIGETTCGKPYGFLGSGKFCDKALYAINIESQNGDNVGNYVNGLTPTCPAQDNYLKAFGDTEENALAEALNYVSTGKCTTSSEKIAQKTKKATTVKLPDSGFKRIMSAY